MTDTAVRPLATTDYRVADISLAEFGRKEIGLAEHERIAGFIHIGRATVAIEDRPRPPLAEIMTTFPE